MTALFQIASPLRGRRSRKRTRRAGRPLWDVLYRLEALERRTVLSGLQIIQTQSYGPDFTDLISYRRATRAAELGADALSQPGS